MRRRGRGVREIRRPGRQGEEIPSQKRSPAKTYAFEGEESLGKSYKIGMTGGWWFLSLKLAYQYM